MKIQAVNNNETTFGYYKMPNKKTFRAMKGFYELRNDKGMAVEYGMRHNEAMARLHYKKFKNAEKDLMAFSDKTYGRTTTFKEKLEAVKIFARMAYEKLASAHYYARFY